VRALRLPPLISLDASVVSSDSSIEVSLRKIRIRGKLAGACLWLSGCGPLNAPAGIIPVGTDDVFGCGGDVGHADGAAAAADPGALAQCRRAGDL
jgi:hypothetical protein